MRIVIFIITIIIFVAISLIGLCLPGPVLAINKPQAIPTSAKVPPTRTTVARTAVINLGGYKLTQTAVASASVQPTATITLTTTTPPTPTKVIIATALLIPTEIRKPQRLPNTGNVDSSDIWNNTPILGLIGICLLVSIGLYWQSKRSIR